MCENENSCGSDIQTAYDKCVRSPIFQKNLKDLNDALVSSLKEKGLAPVLIGNLFYDHAQVDFENKGLLSDCELKRMRLFDVARRSKRMMEIGFNGGHSSFLCLSANADLEVVAIDLAKYIRSIVPACHPEVYVPAGYAALSKIFGKRLELLYGNCLQVVPAYVRSNTDENVDFVHIDGAKDTYKQDFFNFVPILKKGAYVVFDDANMNSIQAMCDGLIKEGFLERCIDFEDMPKTVKYRNGVYKYTGKKIAKVEEDLKAEQALENVVDSREKSRRQVVFENIYDKQLWNNSDAHVPLSGPGSSLANTRAIVAFLDDVVNERGVKSVGDVGCGDLTWMQTTLFFQGEGVFYTGFDIASSVITENKKKFGSEKKSFILHDIAHGPFEGKFDLIILRDVLFHQTIAEGMATLENLRDKFKFICITSTLATAHHDALHPKWHFAPRNILAAPFNRKENYLDKVSEPVFNRVFLLYAHDDFYQT